MANSYHFIMTHMYNYRGLITIREGGGVIDWSLLGVCIVQSWLYSKGGQGYAPMAKF